MLQFYVLLLRDGMRAFDVVLMINRPRVCLPHTYTSVFPEIINIPARILLSMCVQPAWLVNINDTAQRYSNECKI